MVIGLRPEKTLFEYEWAERTARLKENQRRRKKQKGRQEKKRSLAFWQTGKKKNKEQKGEKN